MKLYAPAKINLFLRVLSRRPDGFHDIETLFARVGLYDEIELKAAPSGIRLRSNVRSLPAGPSNTVFRAAALLKERFGVRTGVDIRLTKHIPVAAGLGGGSSDAAAVLMGLNKLWKLGLDRTTLLRIGAEIGSDVPFFLLGARFAIGKGRGEKLRLLTAKTPKIWLCLVKPPFGISTRKAYQGLDPTSLTRQKPDAKLLLHSIHEGNSERLAKLLANSLEGSLNKRFTAISKIKKELVAAGAMGALLSGSGSTVFGIFSSEKRAKRAALFLKKKKSRQIFTCPIE